MLAVSAALSGCGRGDDWQASSGPARVCVDSQGQRVADQNCATRPGGGSGTIHSWYYLSNAWVRESGVPPVGGVVTGGSYIPASGVRYGGVSAGGITRGGFGGTGEGGGEGHGGGE